MQAKALDLRFIINTSFDEFQKHWIEIFMRYLLQHLLLFLLFFISAGCQIKNPVPKHVFFIVIDTLRADHLGCYGYERFTSPTIDRLAKQGILFKNAYSTASSTLESTTSFFTSTTALTNKVYTETISPHYTSLQKCLKQAGYNTLAVISNPWLKTQKHLFIDGFDHYQFIAGSWNSNSTKMVSQNVMNFLDKKFNPEVKNFFYIHYLDPHDPYTPPADYVLFSGKTPTDSLLARGDVYPFSGEVELLRRYKKDPTYAGITHPKPIAENDLNYLISMYDGEIKYVDFHIEKLLARLQEMSILQDSLIIITSDHGEEFLEHRCLRHGFQLYDETIHIPLIFYWPGHLTPMREHSLVSGIDIAPTILELCQIKPPVSMLGENILKEKTDERPVLFATHFLNQEQRGIRTKEWKLIENLKIGEIVIYDIKNDAEERNNLFDNDKRKWNHLFKTFEKLLLKHAPPHNKKRGKKPEIDPKTMEQLKALGYLG